ncbi:MAG: hypothetical protein ACRC6E_12505 [Fusobacteriaceae bacterium]
MDTLNLYYNSNFIKENTGKKYVAVPIQELEIDIYIDKKKLNIYQEIILELFRCGHGDIESIQEVLKFDILDKEEKDDEENEGLGHYIIKELEKLKYIKANEITDLGKEVLEEDLDDEKILGSVFYNTLSKEYIKFMMINKFYENKTSSFFLQKCVINKKENKKIDFGTPGSPKEINIKFLDNSSNTALELDIENFVKIIDAEIRTINDEIEENDLGEKTLAQKDIIKFLKEKRSLLFELRKFKVKNNKRAYMLVTLEKEGVKNSFHPNLLDRSLGEDLKKNKNIKSSFKDFIEEDYGVSKGEKINIRKNFSQKEEEIIKESEGGLENLPELVKLLANLETENSISETQDDKYEKNIQLIYESFGDIFLYLFQKYSERKSLLKERAIKSRLENILRKKYCLDEDISSYYERGLKIDAIPYIKQNKKLIEVFIFVLILEDILDENCLSKYLKKDLSFFRFINKLINERNKFSHSDSENKYLNDELEYDFEAEAKEELIKFIENIFKFKFKNSLELKVMDDEIIQNLEKEAKETIKIEFLENDISPIYSELKAISFSLRYYENFKNPIYKSLFIKKVAILLEKNLKLIMGKLNNSIVLDSSLDGREKIYLKDVEERLFKRSNTSESWIENEFDKIKNEVSISVKNINKTRLKFERGTLNSYAMVFLYSRESSFIKKIIEQCPEFFKLVFIVSTLRKHNGNFRLSIDEDENSEIEEVKKFLQLVYKIQKDILKIKGE